MAVRRGLRGVTAGILALNVGIIVLLRIYPQDNQQIAVVQFLMLILPLTGLVLGAVISERDVSKRRLSEEEERIRLLLESTAEAIYGVDLTGACTFCNPAFLRLMGYESREEILGKNMHDLVHHTLPDGRPYPAENALWDTRWRMERKSTLLTNFSGERMERAWRSKCGLIR